MSEQQKTDTTSAATDMARALTSDLRKIAEVQDQVAKIKHAHVARAILGLGALRSKIASAVTRSPR